VVVVVVI